MTIWEKKIIDAFISHYFASTQAAAINEDRGVLRIRTSHFFPDFDSADPNEKESYLEAAESLACKGIARLTWERRGKGERLKTLSCENHESLFREAGKPYPKTELEKIKTMLDERVIALKKTPLANGEKIITLLEFLSVHFGRREIGQGIDRQTMENILRLLEFCANPEQLERITPRALSILLYRDSKYLENLIALYKQTLSRAEKNIPVPDLSIFERSYPETMISGKIIFKYKDEKTPLVNAGGHILGIPLEHAERIESFEPAKQSAGTVLTIENKETFYALGTPQKHESKELSRFDCFLYAGGYSNRATAAIVKALAASGFSFYHAGDLDPDGILILQHIQDIAKKPVTPLRMDTATFDQYRSWARSLTKPMLRQAEKIREEIKAVPELAGLLLRIKETGRGVEQEIIDYRTI